MTKHYYFLSLILIAFAAPAFSQCTVGEVEVEVHIITDAWGYEVYWELLPQGNGCGNAPLFVGGNLLEVNCLSGGTQVATGGNGYANNNTIIEGTWCLQIGNWYDLINVDDYGDGGTTFEVYEDNVLTYTFNSSGDGNTFTFLAGGGNGVPNDSICNATNILVDGSLNLFDNTGATVETNEPAPPATGCQTFDGWCNSGLDNSVWFTFQAPASGSVNITTCNPGNTFDTQLAVYDSVDCNTPSSFTLLAANDDVPGGCGTGSSTFASTVSVGCLTPGNTYYIQVDGYNGAAGFSEISVTDAGSLTISSTSINIPCNGAYDGTEGSIDLNVGGPVQSIVWLGPNGYNETDEDINGLLPGIYTVTVTTGCGEMAYDTILITEPPMLVNTIDSSQNVTCNGVGDGAIYFSPSGGTPPYVFSWAGPNAFTSTQEDITNLDAGTYHLTTTDANGCAMASTITLLDDGFLPVDLGADTTICGGEYLVLVAPVGNTSYQWQDGSGNQFFLVDGQSLSTGTHTFFVEVTNAGGCTNSDTIVVEILNCTGMAENDNQLVKLYPNPATDVVYLERIIPDGVLTIEIFAMGGKLVTKEPLLSSAERTEISLAHLAKGTYVVRIVGDRFIQHQQVIKQ
jgi:hypothetical protein